MKIGSLFSGIGGLELGLEWAGVGHTVWQVESDAYCRGVLEQHWPNAQRFPDVRDVGAHNLATVDVICGGFPCQDISLAGHGAGLSGDRSGLWYEYLRIVRELRPRYVIVENVRALLVRGMGDVLGGLGGLGYDAEWSCLSAQEVGAPHRRDRVFIVAWRPLPDADRRRPHPEQKRIGRCGNQADAHRHGPQESLADAARDGRKPRRPGDAPEVPRGRKSRRGGEQPHEVADANHMQELQSQGGQPDERRWLGDGGWWATEPDVGRVAHGVPARVDRLRALGNAVVPQCAEIVGRRLMEIATGLQERAA